MSYFSLMNRQVGLYLLMIGGGLAMVGLLIYFFYDKLRWIGRLPGDIHIENEHYRIYIPITTMLLLSAVLSLLVYLIKRFS